MPNLTADQLQEYLSISDTSINVGEASNKLSAIVNALTPDGAVLINVRNRPKAAIIEIAAYLDLLARAEAAEHIRMADEAEAGELYDMEETFAWLDQKKATRRAARAQKQEAA